MALQDARQVKGPEVTHADCSTLVFDTDAKHLYVEREVAHVDVGDATSEIQTGRDQPSSDRVGGCDELGHVDVGFDRMPSSIIP